MAALKDALAVLFQLEDGGPMLHDAKVSALPAQRVWCIIAGLLVLAFWWIYHAVYPRSIDPLRGRLVVAAFPLGAFGLSFASASVRRHFSNIFFIIIYLLLSWFVGLTALNSFNPEYAIALLFVFAALGVVHGLSPDERWPMEYFLVFAVLLVTLVHVLVPAPSVNVLLFFACMLSLAVVLYLALEANIMAGEKLAASEAQHRAVLREMAEGVVLVNADTLRFVKSNPAYRRLIGYTEGELRRRMLFDAGTVGRARFVAAMQEHRRGQQFRLGDVKLRRRDGALIDVEMSANLIDYAGQRLICAVVRDIRKRKQTEQALREAKTHAEEMLRTKTALLTNMSHELRTPLTAIIGFAEVLTGETSGEQKEFAQLIGESGHRLLDTLDAVMRLAELEGDGVHLDSRPVNLSPIAGRAVEHFAERAATKGLLLEVQTDGAVCAFADTRSVRRVLHHLIDNALKFTEAGGVAVHIAAEDAAVVRVRDTGIGIPEELHRDLFDEFRQASTGLTRSHEGNGLGLTIAKRLVELMDGEISIESTPKEGSTFIVHLPLAEGTGEALRRDAGS